MAETAPTTPTGASGIVERITLQVDSPTPNLSGLDAAIGRMNVLAASIARANDQYQRMASFRIIRTPQVPLRGPGGPAPGAGGGGGPGGGGAPGFMAQAGRTARYALSAGTIYGAVKFGRESIASAIELGYEEQRLAQVYKGAREDVRGLTDEILRLAAANGAESKSAMQSAVQWARVLSTRAEIQEAVRTSILASNVAEISSAQATERLSSVMAGFNLQAKDLSGVLGQMNDMSNKCRVSVKDLFDALARTGSIAKQSGLDLSETLGIAAVGIGRTGQTGAILGNAIKSIISRSARPDIQETLRKGFDFEVTVGGGDNVKSMSQLLADLFVKYQELNTSERKSLLWNAAGTAQAGRLAAVLDGYVKAQTLAISAQLNLNSAEGENLLIKASLKNQLAGLVTEWQRFVKLQSDKGPVEAVTEITKSLHTLLAVLNTKGGSWLSGAFLALLTAMSARMLATNFAMARAGQQAGVLGAAMNGLGNTLTRSLAASAPWIQRMAGMGAAGAGAAAGVGMLRGAAALAVGSLAEMLPVMLAVYGVMKLLNAAGEAVGLTSDANDRLVGQSEQRAIAAQNAAEAAARAGKLFETSRKALENSGSQEGRLGMVREMSEATFLQEPGDTKKQIAAKEKLRSELVAELESIERIGDATERNAARAAKFGELEGQAIAMRIRQRQKELELISKQDSADRREIERLKKAPFGSKDRIRDLEDRISGRSGKRVQLLLDESTESDDALAKFQAESVKVKGWEQSQKMIAEGIHDLFSNLPSSGKLDDINSSLAAHIVIRSRLEKQIAANADKMKQLGMAGTGLEELDAQIANKRKALEERAEQIGKTFAEKTGIYAAGAEKDRRMDYKSTLEESRFTSLEVPQEEDIRRFRPNDPRFRSLVIKSAHEEALSGYEDVSKGYTELAGMTEQSGAIRSDKHRMFLESERKRLEEKMEAEQATITGLDNPEAKQIAATQDRRANVVRIAKAESASFAVGADEGEKFIAQQEGLKKSADFHENRAAGLRRKGGDEKDIEESLITATQHRVQLADGLIHAQERLLELRAQELNLIKEKTKEVNRQLLLDSPSGILKRIALSQRGRMSAGAFLSMDQESRRLFLETHPETSPEVQDIHRTQGALGRFILKTAPNNAARDEIFTRGQDAKLGLLGVATGRADVFAPSILPSPQPRPTLRARVQSPMDFMLQTEVANPEEDRRQPKRTVPLSAVPAATSVFKSVAREMDYQGPAPEQLWMYGNRRDHYKVPGEYEPDTNRIKLSANTLDNLRSLDTASKDFLNSVETLAHELTHYVQDMKAGDKTTTVEMGKSGGLTDRINKLVGEGITAADKKSESSRDQTDPDRKNLERLAELIGAKVRGEAASGSFGNNLQQRVSIAGAEAGDGLIRLNENAIAAANSLGMVSSASVRLASDFEALSNRVNRAFDQIQGSKPGPTNAAPHNAAAPL